MENATKALLIAAAVLVSILVISLGLVVYNMASETIDSVNFSGQEITAFNDKFTQYEGTKKRGSEINAMFKTVLSSNMQSNSEGLTQTLGQKFVQVDASKATGVSGGKTKGKLMMNDTSLNGLEAQSSKLFDVSISYNQKSGFVETITVTDAK